MKNNEMELKNYSKIVIFWLIVIGLETHINGDVGNEWTYKGSLGPSHWHTDYPHCGGRKQSPINIDTSKAVLDRSLKPFVFNGFRRIKHVNMTIGNNGHTVQTDLSGWDLTVSGGGLPSLYKTVQFHFHWGSKNRRGSEHYVNGKHFPMEMHFVNFATKHRYIVNAMNKKNGLAVLGFLFKIGRRNRAMDHIVNRLRKISHKNDHVKIDAFPLKSLFPKNLRSYYRYYGSLTTPPCYESVIWTLFKTPIEVSKGQMRMFRRYPFNSMHQSSSFSYGREETISDNYRPIQRLNGRKVYASKRSAIGFKFG